MSFPTPSVFADLLKTYTTWGALKTWLTSAEGGALRVEDYSTPENPYALIRYVKGRSDMSLPHVGAFRSVVWDVMENRPACVTSFKSAAGESLPSDDFARYSIQQFVDGVMIGMFWDKYNACWRIHTRSVLEANSRYFSQTQTFAAMFWGAIRDCDLNALDRDCSYTWILQHPENRIVCPVSRPRAFVVDAARITADCASFLEAFPFGGAAKFGAPKSWDDVRALQVDMDRRYRHEIQGLVVKRVGAAHERWKIRGSEYNRVRHVRGNTARRDFLWLDSWRTDKLRDYLALFPEERAAANATVEKWKRACSDAYHIYVDVFKARSLAKTAIPLKYRPLVYGLHGQYIDALKPANKTVNWKSALEYLNTRDTAQMLFVVNWEVRNAAKSLGLASIPIEPTATVGTTVEGSDEAAAPAPPATPADAPTYASVAAGASVA